MVVGRPREVPGGRQPRDSALVPGVGQGGQLAQAGDVGVRVAAEPADAQLRVFRVVIVVELGKAEQDAAQRAVGRRPPGAELAQGAGDLGRRGDPGGVQFRGGVHQGEQQPAQRLEVRAPDHPVDSRSRKARRADPAGQALVIVTLADIALAIIEGPGLGWTSPLVAGAAVVSVAALVLLLAVELRRTDPLVDIRLFRNARFAALSMSAVLVTALLAGWLFLTTLYLQDVRDKVTDDAPGSFGGADTYTPYLLSASWQPVAPGSALSELRAANITGSGPALWRSATPATSPPGPSPACPPPRPSPPARHSPCCPRPTPGGSATPPAEPSPPAPPPTTAPSPRCRSAAIPGSPGTTQTTCSPPAPSSTAPPAT
jgi:hypothetical protein